MEYVWKSSLWIGIFQRPTQPQEYYWPTIYRTGAAVVSTITSVLLFGYNRIGVINQTPVNTFHVRWILSLSLTRLPVKQKIAGFSPSDSIQWHERLNCCRRSSVRSLNKISFTCRIPANSHALGVSLTPAHACGPISHVWLKNVSCCRPAWNNFQNMLTQTHVRNENHV